MAESTPSFKETTIRVGTKPTRIRWGMSRPQHGAGTTSPEVSTDNPPTSFATDSEVTAGNQNETDMVGKDTKQSTQKRVESVTTHEALPPVELPSQVLFAGKYFLQDGGTSDHVGNSNLLPYYNGKGISDSGWSNDHIYSNPREPIQIRPSKFSAPKYHIYAVRPLLNSVAEANIEWMTEGDWDMERGITRTIGATCRIFPNTEMRLLDPQMSISLLKKGYNPWTALTDRENLIWTANGVIDRSGRNAQTQWIKDPAKENILITGNEPSLWENKQWLQEDPLTAAIADTYLEITQGKYVTLTKPDAHDPKQSVLVAQAVAQMLAVKYGKHIWWVTEPNILQSMDRKIFHLTFADKKPEYTQPGDVFINLPSSKVTANNQTTVENIRKVFSNSLPQALEMWKNLPYLA
jgi:hypothetical protein